MSRYITIETEIDLDDYKAEIEDCLKPSYDLELKEYVKNMEKNLYFYTSKEIKTYEQIYEDLKRIIGE